MNSKTKLRSCLLAFACGIVAMWSASAQTYVRYVQPSDLATRMVYSDTLLTSITLPWGVSRLDNYPKFNAAAYELSRVLQDPDKELLQVWVCGSASPDGLWQYNVDLAQRRTDEAARYLKDVLGIPAHKIHAENLDEDWDRLAELIEASDLDYKYQILHIIKNKTWGDRKKALQQLDEGRVWKILLKDYFPKLRCVRFAIFCKWDPTKPYLTAPVEVVPEPVPAPQPVPEPAPVCEPVPVVAPAPAPKPAPAVKDTIYIRDTVYYVKEVVYVPVEQPVDKPVVTVETPSQVRYEGGYYERPQRVRVPREKKYWDTPLYMGVKTNLLADAMIIPEAGVEFQLSKKMSLDLQGWVTNYNILTPTDKNASIYGFAPELRWWRNDAMRTGSFYGVHANCAWYTLQWKDLLYQNGPEDIWEGNYHDSGNSTPAWSLGLTYGYVVGLGPQKNWGLELVIGLGYAHYMQNTAKLSGETWMLVEHQNQHHFGITRAGVNLTYRFNVRRVRKE